MTSSHPTPAPCQWFDHLAAALDRRSAPRLALLFLGAILALAGMAALAAVSFLLVRDGNAVWGLADDAWRPSPWDQLRLRRAAGGRPGR